MSTEEKLQKTTKESEQPKAEKGTETQENPELSEEKQIEKAESEANKNLTDAENTLKDLQEQMYSELDQDLQQEISAQIEAQKKAIDDFKEQIAQTKAAEVSEPAPAESVKTETTEEKPSETKETVAEGVSFPEEFKNKLGSWSNIDAGKDYQSNLSVDISQWEHLKSEGEDKLMDKLNSLGETSQQYRATTNKLLDTFLEKLGLSGENYERKESSFYNLTEEKKKQFESSLQKIMLDGDLDKIKERYDESNKLEKELEMTVKAMGGKETAGSPHTRQDFVTSMDNIASTLKLTSELAKKLGILEGEAEIDKDVENESKENEENKKLYEFIKNNSQQLASFEDLKKKLPPRFIEKIEDTANSYKNDGRIPYTRIRFNEVVFIDEKGNLQSTKMDNMPIESDPSSPDPDEKKYKAWDKIRTSKKFTEFERILADEIDNRVL